MVRFPEILKNICNVQEGMGRGLFVKLWGSIQNHAVKAALLMHSLT